MSEVHPLLLLQSIPKFKQVGKYALCDVTKSATDKPQPRVLPPSLHFCFCFPLPKVEGAKEPLQECFCGVAVNKGLIPSLSGDEWECPRLLMM